MLVVQGSGDYIRSYAFITNNAAALILHASKPYNNYSFICQYNQTDGGKFLEDWHLSVPCAKLMCWLFLNRWQHLPCKFLTAALLSLLKIKKYLVQNSRALIKPYYYCAFSWLIVIGRNRNLKTFKVPLERQEQNTMFASGCTKGRPG